MGAHYQYDDRERWRYSKAAYVQIVKFFLENSWNAQRITKLDCQ